MLKNILLGFTVLVTTTCAQLLDIVQKPNTFSLCKGGHPRCEATPPSSYGYHQFGGSSAIGGVFAISEILPAGPPIAHHQTFISEIVTRRPDSNAVAGWFDGAAVVDKSRVWGGFASARSGFGGQPRADAQLIGMQIDVLNGGLPGVYPNQSKVGLQIVGFGNANTNGIELSTDRDEGQWQNGFNVQPKAIAPDGAVFGIGPQSARVGLSMLGSKFSDAAVLIGVDQKIVFRSSTSLYDASIYRDNFSGGYLVLTAGPAGMRVTDAQNTRNLLKLNPDGSVDRASMLWRFYAPWLYGAAVVLAVLIVLTVLLSARIARLERLLGERNNEYPRDQRLTGPCRSNVCVGVANPAWLSNITT